MNWGLALIRRNDPPKYSSEDEVPPEEIVYGRFSDADQAIARLHEGLVRIFNDANINARLQRGLGDAYLKKYESSNGEYDLTNALQYYQAGLIAPIPNAEIRAGLLKAKGKALILNKEHQKALSCFTEGLGLEFENEVLREGLQKSIQVVERLLEQSSSE